MTAAELLTTLCNRGLTVRADRDSLIVQPRELLTDELRTAIRAQKAAILAELTAANDPGDSPPDSRAARRRARALALLEANPNWRRAVICEAGNPAIIGIAVRTFGYGELEIPTEKYDPVAIMALLDRHGETTQ